MVCMDVLPRRPRRAGRCFVRPLLAWGWVAVACVGLGAGAADAQLSASLDFVAEITFPASNQGCATTAVTGGSDVWGYTAPDGTDYAIMGVKEGVAVVQIPSMQVIDVVPGPQQFDCWWHRDIKTLGHYAYAVAEMAGQNEGLMIMDLSALPDSVHFVGSYVHANQVQSHNLTIDTVTGFAYICNQSGTGFRVVDLADPENPVEVGEHSTGSIHDVYAHDDFLYVAEGWTNDFSVYDMSIKTAPQLIGVFTYPGAGYTHNIWPTTDGRHVVTTEETTDKTIKVWNVEDLTQVALVGEYLAPNRLAHNVHVMGDVGVVSHYAYGVVVLDLTDPANPTEIAHYDSYLPDDAPGFWGCWGVYPYTENGYVYASDFRGHLTVLSLTTSTTGIAAPQAPSRSLARLAPAAPNPFNPRTTLTFELAEDARTSLAIYTAAGHRVRVLVDGATTAAGVHQLEWDGRDDRGAVLPSGTYLQRLTAGEPVPYEVTRKLVLIR